MKLPLKLLLLLPIMIDETCDLLKLYVYIRYSTIYMYDDEILTQLRDSAS